MREGERRGEGKQGWEGEGEGKKELKAKDRYG